MDCITGKRSYESEELALEALVQNHILHDHREGSGPVNVYQCQDCSAFHLTSKGLKAIILEDKRVIERIQKEKRANDWGLDLLI